jgi:hypothetical protein
MLNNQLYEKFLTIFTLILHNAGKYYVALFTVNSTQIFCFTLKATLRNPNITLSFSLYSGVPIIRPKQDWRTVR